MTDDALFERVAHPPIMPVLSNVIFRPAASQVMSSQTYFVPILMQNENSARCSSHENEILKSNRYVNH